MTSYPVLNVHEWNEGMINFPYLKRSKNVNKNKAGLKQFPEVCKATTVKQSLINENDMGILAGAEPLNEEGSPHTW